MIYLRIFLTLFLIHTFGLILAQNPVSLFILDSPNRVDSTLVADVYSQAGFTPDISISEINTTLNVSNFKVAFIAEGYSYDNSTNDFEGNFLTENQRAIVQNFVNEGGHVVWLTENWDDYPNSLAAYQTINNIYETDISEGSFFNNIGINSTSIYRIHPSMGPSGLSLTDSVFSSGSFSTMLDVPNCNKLYTPEATDNSGNTFDVCTHTVLAVFPARPKPDEGSIIISSEIGIPLKSWTTWSPLLEPLLNYNEELDSSIALLHYKLIIKKH